MVHVSFPGFEKNVVPIVLIGSCYAKTIDANQNALREFTERPEVPEFTFIRATQAERGVWNQEGTLSDLYKIAVRAADRDWKSIMVLDPLSWRQLCGNYRFGDRKALSAIVLTVRQRPPPLLPSARPEFVVRRLKFGLAVDQCSSQKAEMYTMQGVPPNPRPLRYWNAVRRRAERYMQIPTIVLRDPLCRAFTEDGIPSATTDELCQIFSETKPPLPLELAVNISTYAQSPLGVKDMSEAVLEKPGWREEEILPVALLFPVDDKQATQIQELLQQHLTRVVDSRSEASSDGIPHRKVVLRRWLQPHLGTRRDLLRIFAWIKKETLSARLPTRAAHSDFFLDETRAHFYFFIDEIPTGTGPPRVILALSSKYCRSDVIVRTNFCHTLQEMREAARSIVSNCYDHAESEGTLEHLIQPDDTFPQQQGPFSRSEKIRGHRYFYMPVLFTMRFDAKDLDAVKTELHTCTATDLANADKYLARDSVHLSQFYLGDDFNEPRLKRILFADRSEFQTDPSDDEIEPYLSDDVHEHRLKRILYVEQSETQTDLRDDEIEPYMLKYETRHVVLADKNSPTDLMVRVAAFDSNGKHLVSERVPGRDAYEYLWSSRLTR